MNDLSMTILPETAPTRCRSNGCTSAPSAPAAMPAPPIGCVSIGARSSALSFTARIGTLLVGSVRLSPIRIGETVALLLGPLTIEPPFRDRGIGQR